MQPSPEKASSNRLTLQLKPPIGSIYSRALRLPRVRTALTDAAVGRASYWDALLVATAGEAGCRVILTEDLADGADLSGVRIRNPFSPSGGLTEHARGLLGLPAS
jgi:hypothetical protein